MSGQWLLKIVPPFQEIPFCEEKEHGSLRRCHLAAVVVGSGPGGSRLVRKTTGGQTPLDPIMGEFEGTVTLDNGKTLKAEAKVLADEAPQVPGCPPLSGCRGQGIEGRRRRSASRCSFLLLRRTRPRPSASTGCPASARTTGRYSSAARSDWKGTINQGGALKLASEKVEAKAELKRVERKSPTLGQKPPAGSIVLLPFEEGKPTNLDQWAKNPWVCESDGSISTRDADIKTNKDFGSFKLHVEFRVPFMPAARGQGRGNSGVFLHGRYDIQILDSFGLKPTPVDCAEFSTSRPPTPMPRCRPDNGRPTTSTSRPPRSTPTASRPRVPWSRWCGTA